MVAIVLPFEKPGPAAVRITRDWYAPVGGVLMAGCGLYAMIGFPLDDVWHRIFGQDVTLWSATHVLMIGGMALAVLGTIMLNVEGLRARTRSGKPFRPTLWNLPLRTFQWLLMPATVLLILSLLQ